MLVFVSLQGVEDPLLELKTPTLFIIGSHSTLTSQEDVEVQVLLIVVFATPETNSSCGWIF